MIRRSKPYADLDAAVREANRALARFGLSFVACIGVGAGFFWLIVKGPTWLVFLTVAGVASVLFWLGSYRADVRRIAVGKWFPAVLLALFLACFVCIYASFGKLGCSSFALGAQLRSDYSLMAGCRLLHDGRWWSKDELIDLYGAR